MTKNIKPPKVKSTAARQMNQRHDQKDSVAGNIVKAGLTGFRDKLKK